MPPLGCQPGAQEEPSWERSVGVEALGAVGKGLGCQPGAQEEPSWERSVPVEGPGCGRERVKHRRFFLELGRTDIKGGGDNIGRRPI